MWVGCKWREVSRSLSVKIDISFHDINWVQCRHLLPAPVDGTSASSPVVHAPMGNISREKAKHTNALRSLRKSKLRSVAMSSMHSFLGNWVTIGRAVVYYSRAAQTLSAGIKCRHCSKWRGGQGRPFSQNSGFLLRYQQASHDFILWWRRNDDKQKSKFSLRVSAGLEYKGSDGFSKIFASLCFVRRLPQDW